MVPADVTHFYALVFRGGDVRFLPAAIAYDVMKNKANGQITVAIEYPEPNMVDLTAVERIEPFDMWRKSTNLRLAASHRKVCPFGIVHEENDKCECHMKNQMPLLEVTARSLVKRATDYTEMSPDERNAHDDSRGPWLRDLIESGYIHDVASAYNLPILLKAQTHGEKI